MSIDERLHLVVEELRQGRTPTWTVRELLTWYGASRRGYWINLDIRQALRKAGLQTEPDFESAYIGAELRFLPAGPPESEAAVSAEKPAEPPPVPVAAPELPPPAADADPTYRISKLASANCRPTSVPPDAAIERAATVMLTNDFSQLPVMSGEREIKGVVSWSSIGQRLALGKRGATVQDFMDPHQEIRSDASLFTAIPIISQHGYVLVRGRDNRVVGIVTASDLNLQFHQLAEPFLLLGEIENHIRRLIDNRFSLADLADVKDPADATRDIRSVADLTFGEYVRLLENPGRWANIKLLIDRVAFLEHLERVRRIRNDVMHFDPDGIPEADLEALRDFTGFLRRLQDIGLP